MKKLILLSTLAFISIDLSAQMTDISVTAQPTGSYNWFDKNTNIDDGFMYGGRVGFSFGEAMEIRALYEKSADIKNTIKNLNFASDEFLQNFTNREVTIERMGGEFKANIPTRGTFIPYLTLGAGVQKLKVDVAELGFPTVERKSEQIYGNLGLGTQVRLGDRLFLNLEAKNTVFNMDPADVLYREGANSGVGDWLNDKTDRMYNWSVLAGLQFYLGGREPGSMSDLDRAYYRKFSGGMGGFKLILEPGGSFINFNGESNLKNTYLLGGKAGFDLNQFIGLRGFYYQATQDEEISTKWDNLAIYGGDIVAKLNVARGVIPYLEIGGGYLNVYDNYEGLNTLLPVQQSGYFAKGGVGVSIPLAKNFEVFGSANLMYTAQRASNDLQNIIRPSELTKHTMYNAGIKFKLGRSANTDDIIESRVDTRVKERTDVYQDRIKQLEKDLQIAYDHNDIKKAVEIIEEKESLEDKKMILDTKENAKVRSLETDSIKTEESRVIMTPEELEKLIERVIQGVDDEKKKPATAEERIDRLERLLLDVNSDGVNSQGLSLQGLSSQENSRSGAISSAQQELATDRILDKLNQLNSKIDNNSANISNLATGKPQVRRVYGLQETGKRSQNITPATTIDSQLLDQQGLNIQRNVDPIYDPRYNLDPIAARRKSRFFVREGLSPFAGYAFGNGSSALLGIRGHYSVGSTAIKFMPDLYIGTGSNTGFGINTNALLAFDQIYSNVILAPYIGFGVGYNNIANLKKFGTNLIVGTSFDILGGNLYADYTARNFIDIHQVSIGYKFKF